MSNRNAIVVFLIANLFFSGPVAVLSSETCEGEQVTPLEFSKILNDDEAADFLVLDMRSLEDFLIGTIPTAISIGQLQQILDGAHEDSQTRLVVVVTEDGSIDVELQQWIYELCERGVETWILRGGISGWRGRDLVLEKPEDRLTEPGSVPFVIPRGLCEMNDPVLEYN